ITREEFLEFMQKFLPKVQEAREVHSQLAYSMGIYFGFPKCCIEEFCQDLLNNRDPLRRQVGTTDFIPCRKHFVEIKLGNIRLGDLIQNRICPTPFPIDRKE
ncbi:MAG: hypothetical protein ACFE9R_13600, partial [Candidatus Hermodarchaeota archaeon]